MPIHGMDSFRIDHDKSERVRGKETHTPFPSRVQADLGGGGGKKVGVHPPHLPSGMSQEGEPPAH